MKVIVKYIANRQPEEKDWERAEAYALRENQAGGAAAHSTRFRALYGDMKLFLRYEVEDDYILANMTEDNDNLYEEEAVELFYSPDGDPTRYFELEFNVNEAVFFALIHNPNGSKQGMSCLLHSREGIECNAARTPDGYTVTVSVPFAAIGGSPSAGASCNVFRIDYFREGDSQLNALSPTLCDSFHVPACFAEIEWSAGRERQKRLHKN